MVLNLSQAQHIARIIHALRKDFPKAAVVSKLQSSDFVGWSDLQVITAAFMAAADPQAKTIQVMGEKLRDLVAEQTWGGGSEKPYPVLGSRQSHCEIHDWCPPPPYCGACRSEQIALEPAHTPA